MNDIERPNDLDVSTTDYLQEAPMWVFEVPAFETILHVLSHPDQGSWVAISFKLENLIKKVFKKIVGCL